MLQISSPPAESLSVVMSLQSPGLSALIAASSVALMKYLLPVVSVFN